MEGGELIINNLSKSICERKNHPFKPPGDLNMFYHHKKFCLYKCSCTNTEMNTYIKHGNLLIPFSVYAKETLTSILGKKKKT